MALTRANECGSVLPLFLLLVLEGEIVAHDDKVTVLVRVLESDARDVSEGVEAGSSLALGIVDFECGGSVKELEEVESLDDRANGLLLEVLVSAQVAHIGPREHPFDQETVVSLHAVGQLVADLLLEAGEWAGIDDGEPPEAEVLKCAHSVSHWVIRCETNIVEAGNNLRQKK